LHQENQYYHAQGIQLLSTIYCIEYVLSLTKNYIIFLGEPHIDGEPGDLRFVIRQIK